MWSSTSTTRPSHWLLPFVLRQHLGNLTHFYGWGSRFISAVFSQGTATWWIIFCHWYHLISHFPGRNSIDHTASVFFPSQLRFNRACLCLRLLATSRCAGCEVENQHTAGAPLDFIQHGGKSLCCPSVLYGRLIYVSGFSVVRRAPCSAGPSRPPKWDLFGKVKELGRTGVQKSIQVMMHQYLSQRHGPTGLDTSEFGWERSSGQAGKRMFQKSETFGTVHHQLFFAETKLRSICIYIYIMILYNVGPLDVRHFIYCVCTFYKMV